MSNSNPNSPTDSAGATIQFSHHKMFSSFKDGKLVVRLTLRPAVQHCRVRVVFPNQLGPNLETVAGDPPGADDQ